MTIRRVFALCATICATLLLTGCFVVSKNLPAGKAVNDERLVGAWMGVEDGGGTPGDAAYLHFQFQDDATKPLRLVWVEGKNYQIYEFITLGVGNKNVFAATLLAPLKTKKDKNTPAGYYLGFYELNDNDAVFHLLDAEKVGELIGRGKLKGIKPPGKYDFATLTGSPSELARFLGSPEADAARGEPAKLRRLQPPVKK